MPTAILSRSAKRSPLRASSSATSGSSRVAWPGCSPGAGSSRACSVLPSWRRRPIAVAGVAVSKPSTIIRAATTSIRRRSAPRWARVTRRRASPSSAVSGLRPLDERDPSRAEVLGQQFWVLALEPLQPVQVEMADDHVPAAIAVADAERRAGDRVAHAQRARRAAYERGLARADLARDQDNIASAQPGRQLGANSLGLSRICGLDDAHCHDETLEPKQATGLRQTTGPRESSAGRLPLLGRMELLLTMYSV